MISFPLLWKTSGCCSADRRVSQSGLRCRHVLAAEMDQFRPAAAYHKNEVANVGRGWRYLAARTRSTVKLHVHLVQPDEAEGFPEGPGPSAYRPNPPGADQLAAGRPNMRLQWC